MSGPEANRSLSAFTSLGVGGPAASLRRVADPDEIARVLATVGDDRGPDSLLILGGGTNVVISDEGFPGSVLVVDGGRIEARSRGGGDEVEFTVDAGVPWDDLVADSVRRGCGGLEMMSGIPGSVGAAPMQNIAAYGQQVCDVIESVEVIDRATLETEVLSADDCGFGFRSSRFKSDLRDRFVVTKVRLVLPGHQAVPPQPSTYIDIEKYFEREGGSPIDVGARRAAVLSTRRVKSMLLDPHDPNARSVGSFFVNPLVPVALARELVERFRTQGLRVEYLEGSLRRATTDAQRIPAALVLRASGFNAGDSWGPVGLSAKHVLALVTTPGAMAEDVWLVGNHMRRRVEEVTGVRLAFESTFVGAFPDYDAAAVERRYRFVPASADEPAWMTSYR